MEKSKSYLELERIKSKYLDENDNYKTLTQKDAKFKIQILDILIVENPNTKDDFAISFETKHLSTLEEKTLTLNQIELYYI
jgi:FKBP-type peptidyl-prolyl cis-trans isomerase (trigger factor)